MDTHTASHLRWLRRHEERCGEGGGEEGKREGVRGREEEKAAGGEGRDRQAGRQADRWTDRRGGRAREAGEREERAAGWSARAEETPSPSLRMMAQRSVMSARCTSHKSHLVKSASQGQIIYGLQLD